MANPLMRDNPPGAKTNLLVFEDIICAVNMREKKKKKKQNEKKKTRMTDITWSVCVMKAAKSHLFLFFFGLSFWKSHLLSNHRDLWSLLVWALVSHILHLERAFLHTSHSSAPTLSLSLLQSLYLYTLSFFSLSIPAYLSVFLYVCLSLSLSFYSLYLHLSLLSSPPCPSVPVVLAEAAGDVRPVGLLGRRIVIGPRAALLSQV